MKINKEACTGCGICASVCPGNAIETVKDNLYTEISGKVKMICCENSGGTVEQNCETVACGGGINAGQLADALGKYEKVIVVVCKDGACRHFDGNKRACLQTDRISSMLSKAGVSEGRVCLLKKSYGEKNDNR